MSPSVTPIVKDGELSIRHRGTAGGSAIAFSAIAIPALSRTEKPLSAPLDRRSPPHAAKAQTHHAAAKGAIEATRSGGIDPPPEPAPAGESGTWTVATQA